MMIYQFSKGKGNWADYYGLEKQPGSSAQQFAYSMDIPKAKVLRIDGFGKYKEYEIENRKDIEEFGLVSSKNLDLEAKTN